jgi:hypothetical protein
MTLISVYFPCDDQHHKQFCLLFDSMLNAINPNCQKTSKRDTANKHSLELCASIVHVFLDGCSKWYFSVVFLTGQVLSNWYL